MRSRKRFGAPPPVELEVVLGGVAGVGELGLSGKLGIPDGVFEGVGCGLGSDCGLLD